MGHGADGGIPLPHISLAGYAWLGRQVGAGEKMLPGLRDIQLCNVSSDDSKELAFIPLLLSPSIESVSFRGAFTLDAIFVSFTLPLVCDEAQSVRRLSIQSTSLHDREPDNGIWDSLINAVAATSLGDLNLQLPPIHTMPPSFLKRLASSRGFRNVTTLTLDVHTAQHTPSNDIPSLQHPLPALTEVNIINRSEANLCPCYPHYLLRRATSITFVLSQSILSSDAFTAAVDFLCSVWPLKRVAFEMDGAASGIAISPEALLPFFRIALRELHIGVSGLWNRDLKRGAEIVELIDGMRGRGGQTRNQLHSLVLPIMRPRPLHGHTFRRGASTQALPLYPAIASLLDVARGARGLRHIRISIDSSVVSVDDGTLQSILDRWSKGCYPSDLRHLELADMRPSGMNFTPRECRSISRLLDAIFPKLEELTTVKIEGVKNTWDEYWEHIEEYRKLEKCVRLYRFGIQ